jgi:hypothetical protein
MKNPYQLVDRKTNKLMENSLGYEQLVTTLTAVSGKVSTQKFYEILPADYMPVVEGVGSYMRHIINWRTYSKSDGFEAAIMNNASNKARIPVVDAAFDQLPQNVYNWSRAVMWDIFELEEAMQANSLFSLIEARETARVKEWQLGIQKVAFKGYSSEAGLLNQSTVTVDTATISKRLYSMTSAEFNAFVGTIYGQYRAATAFTARPTHFIIPEADYNGLISFPDATYPLKTRLEILLDAFKTITGNASFKILPCAYCDKANFDGTNNRYVLLNYDPTSVKFDIPLSYTSTSAGTVNGFVWENVAYGQFAPVIALREKEMLYFSNTAT